MQIHSARIKAAEYARNIHLANPLADTPFEEILKPGYWAHVAKTFKPGDRIEVIPEEGGYFAELYVIDSGHLSVKVAVLRKVDFDGAREPAINAVDLFEVKWGSNTTRFRVIRKSDKAVLQENFADKEAANVWLKENLHTLV